MVSDGERDTRKTADKSFDALSTYVDTTVAVVAEASLGEMGKDTKHSSEESNFAFLVHTFRLVYIDYVAYSRCPRCTIRDLHL